MDEIPLEHWEFLFWEKFKESGIKHSKNKTVAWYRRWHGHVMFLTSHLQHMIGAHIQLISSCDLHFDINDVSQPLEYYLEKQATFLLIHQGSMV